MSRPDPALPVPDADARAHSARVVAHMCARDRRRRAAGSRSRDYMELALYAPGLGYYAAGAPKFGAAGDFVTAPEMTPLFGAALAAQVDAVLAATAGREIVELGAGSGRLAADLLGRARRARRAAVALRDPRGQPGPRASGSARRIAARAPALAGRVEWLDALPAAIDGAVVANEVLDAIPSHLVARRGGALLERGVVVGRRGAVVRLRRPAGESAPRGARRRALSGARRRALPGRRRLPVRSEPRRRGAGRDRRPPARGRRAARRRLRLPRRRVLPPAARPGHADVPLPASRARRPVPVAGAVRHHRARRLHARSPTRACAPGSRSRASPRRRRSCWAAACSTRWRRSARRVRRLCARPRRCRSCCPPPRWASCSRCWRWRASDGIAWPGFALADRRAPALTIAHRRSRHGNADRLQQPGRWARCPRGTPATGRVTPRSSSHRARPGEREIRLDWREFDAYVNRSPTRSPALGVARGDRVATVLVELAGAARDLLGLRQAGRRRGAAVAAADCVRTRVAGRRRARRACVVAPASGSRDAGRGAGAPAIAALGTPPVWVLADAAADDEARAMRACRRC